MALTPLKDYNAIVNIKFQYITTSIIILCCIVFIWQLSLGPENRQFIFGLGIIPTVLLGMRELSHDLILIPASLTLFTSLFLHGGWLHLIFNMLFLWVFGDNVEDSMGHLRFICFYFTCGILASLSHVFVESNSSLPLIGASGAISGVLGAYIVLHPKAKVLVLFMNIIPLRLPSLIVLGGWIGLQFLSLNNENGTAWWAHIGGFLAGVILVFPFKRKFIFRSKNTMVLHSEKVNMQSSPKPKHSKSIFPKTSRRKR